LKKLISVSTIALAIICLGQVAVFAGDKDASTESLSFLKSNLPKLKVENRHGNLLFKYCPDNTCELIKAENVPISVSADFAFLYFSFISSWTNSAFQKFQSSSKYLGKQILARNLYGCKPELPETAGCVVRSMTEKFGFKIVSSTYDEGEVCDTEYSLEDLINHKSPKNPPETKCLKLKNESN